MKKIKLLVAPLLSVAFLASCGGGNTPSVDIHVVNEQEFNDACGFKNVQYLQAELTSVSDGVTYTCPTELSPTVSHMINESSTPSYYEIFVQKKSDGSYERAIRDDKSKDEYSFEPASESDFLTPQSTSVNVLIQLQHVGLSYSSFTYDSKAGTYSATFTPEGSETSVTTTLKFENKILISDVSVGEVSGTQTTTFTYENKTPEYPENPGPGPANKSIKKIEGTFSEGIAPDGTTATFEYEYTSPTSFAITDTLSYLNPTNPGEIIEMVMTKHYHEMEVIKNDLVTDTYIIGKPKSPTLADGFELDKCWIYTYDAEGFIVRKQELLKALEFEEWTHEKEVIDLISVDASFDDSNSDTFSEIREWNYLYDQNNNLTHELSYELDLNTDDKYELQLDMIDEYEYNENNQIVSNYSALSSQDTHYGIDYTYDQNGIIKSHNADLLTFKNKTTAEFFEDYSPYLTPLSDEDFNRVADVRWSYAYKPATEGDYSKYTLEEYAENLEETNPTPTKKYALQDYYDVEIKEDGTKEDTYYNFKQDEYYFDTVEYRDMSSEIDEPSSKYEYVEDKYGNRIKEIPYDYVGGQFVIDDYALTEFKFDEGGLLEELKHPAGELGVFTSTNIEYCDTEADYHQNQNWIFNNAYQFSM